MKATIINLLMAMLVAASLQIHAQGTLIYDQESATSPLNAQTPGVDFLNIQEDSPLAQSFAPSLSAIDFIQFEFSDIPDNGTAGATVDVKLYSGSPNPNSTAATLIATTAAVYMTNGFGYDSVGLSTFYFSIPIALTAGNTYYLEPVVLSGDNPWDIMDIQSTYPNGQLFENGFGFDSDLWFREGVVSTPEPSDFALIGLGSLLILGYRRSQKGFTQ